MFSVCLSPFLFFFDRLHLAQAMIKKSSTLLVTQILMQNYFLSKSFPCENAVIQQVAWFAVYIAAIGSHYKHITVSPTFALEHSKHNNKVQSILFCSSLLTTTLSYSIVWKASYLSIGTPSSSERPLPRTYST